MNTLHDKLQPRSECVRVFDLKRDNFTFLHTPATTTRTTLACQKRNKINRQNESQFCAIALRSRVCLRLSSD